MPKIVIAGCGFLGEAAAGLFLESGWDVLGLCATPESAARLTEKKIPVRVVDISRELAFDPPWRGADALLHCASTRGGDAAAYRAVYLDGLLNLMAAVQPRRAAFVSSTSVYGQTDGGWVDENSETAPQSETGRILCDAEGVALAAGGYVVRLAGLYGPGRSAWRDRFLAGVVSEGDRWTNQIHRDDAARAIHHLFANRILPGIYNVCDDHPATPAEIQGWLTERFGAPPEPGHPPTAPRKRPWTNKRVSNARLRATGWQPHFASYRDGLATLD